LHEQNGGEVVTTMRNLPQTTGSDYINGQRDPKKRLGLVEASLVPQIQCAVVDVDRPVGTEPA